MESQKLCMPNENTELKWFPLDRVHCYCVR